MLRLLFRFIGLLGLATAFAMLVIDGTRSIAGGALSLTRLGQTAASLFPIQFPLLRPAIIRELHPLVWDPVLTTFFQVPTWLLIGACGLVLLGLTRKPAPKIGYSNR